MVVVGEDAKTSPCDKSSSDNHASKLTIDAEVSFDVIVVVGCVVSRLSSLVTSVAKLAVDGKRGVLVASTFAARATKVPNVLE